MLRIGGAVRTGSDDLREEEEEEGRPGGGGCDELIKGEGSEGKAGQEEEGESA